MSKELLIISCSMRKNKKEGKIRAWDLYDGVIYRVLKKNKVDFDRFDVAIISAKYGLIDPNDEIEYYDQLMTNSRAIVLQKNVMEKLNILLNINYRKIHVCLGKNYLICISSIIKNGNEVEIINGGIGIKMKRLKEIINSEANIDS